MKLNVGLVTYSAMWEQLLAQEGVPFSYAELDTIRNECSVLAVNHPLDDSEKKQVEAYLQSGGAVLGYAEHLRGVCGTTSRREQLDYLVADHDEVFPAISLVDAGILADIPQEANCLRTQQNTLGVFAGPLGGGHAVIFPFDAAVLMADARAANKSFYSARERLPSERVSLVGKGEMRRLLHRALEYLHHAQNLPYTHVWYFPHGAENLFAFRIDSDKGSRKEIDELYEVARENDIRMSWFLDVKNHEEWLEHFAFLSGQEIGIHCYEHQTYETYDANLKNILKAKHKLEHAGISSPGFTAPFGIWNVELARALDQIGFEYSSEFSFAYDTLPFYPSDGEKTFTTLQVPIHPICIGSVRKIGSTMEQTKEYFRRVMDEKQLRNEPLFFYHHPTHHCWDVVQFMFQYVKEKGIGNTTMLDYARWWKKRLRYRPEIVFENDQLKTQSSKQPDDSVGLRVVKPDKSEAFVVASAEIDLQSLTWRPARPVANAPSDIRRIREFDPRGMLGDLFTTLTRKFSERRTGE